tara:strand:- start:88 stop:408 length:321 start_codon:yes stop_codon:yes gene_type:complete
VNYAQIGLNLKLMTYKVEEINNISVVHLNGEIDMDVADKARQTILPLIENGKSVQINLSKVDYMDSSGISVLIEGKQLAEKKSTKFELIEVSKPVEKVLSMARKFL